MPGTTTQFKLGLFSLAALAGVSAAAIGLGLRGARSESVRYQTYFDESAQGLDLGAPVKYRGVKIGSVGDISIAPDADKSASGSRSIAPPRHDSISIAGPLPCARSSRCRASPA